MAPGLPYAFAARSSVVAEADTIAFRETTRLAAVIEAQRLEGADRAWTALDDAAFDARLRAHGDDRIGPVDFSVDEAAAFAESAAATTDLLDAHDDSPVIRLINALLLQAVRLRASDIHIETHERRCIVRFRVDGVLRDIVAPAAALAPSLVSRIKVMAALDIAEKRLPQDGRVSVRVGGRDIDVRVATLPTRHGERVVLRVLARDTAALDLEGLGMGAAELAAFARLLARPTGLLLVTGPTGSGKTTTLYAALNRLNDGRRNIVTVEDPVEYELDGVGQVQVNPRIGLDFARGLRAVLRQDPDVIMVGEIRDAETAAMAVRASTTGHFVLATLHTSSATGSIARLVDMGVERYLLAPMLAGVVAQRLVRTLCTDCRAPDHATPLDHALLGGALAVGTPLFRARGCPTCHDEGYAGRTGLYEVIELDAAMRSSIHDGAAEAVLDAAARARAASLLDDGVARIAAGVTTVDEVARVVRDDG